MLADYSVLISGKRGMIGGKLQFYSGFVPHRNRLPKNNQTPEGIRIPKALVPYTGFEMID